MDGQRRVHNRGAAYALAGFSMIVVAPALWALLRLVFLPYPGGTLWEKVFGDPGRSFENILLYCFIGVGAAAMASICGYLFGKTGDQLRSRADELEKLHRAGVSQAELYESRCRALDDTIKKFHRISARIQKSLDVQEVLSLCAEGLHDVLGFERVNILM
ncbi:MAG: chemotaxis protein, partial [Geobacteraceae bacterium]|nr:chemotaxis protein [Geobacteraceae bacterium]